MSPEINSITIHIPMTFKRRGGRKLVITPDGVAPAVPVAVDDTMMKLLVKAHCWRRRIESGKARSITDLAGQENVSATYITRILALTCLAPDITMAILDGCFPRGLSMNTMVQGRA